VVSRGLGKRAPFLRNKNSVADAVLIELYATVAQARGDENYCFVTSSWEDYSVQKGDHRLPHPDIANLFDGATSKYFLGVAGASLKWCRYVVRTCRKRPHS
jgi:hypothetical protein